MAYEFKPYRSVYRDPQSVKISEVLRNRYVDNFASDSLLDKSLNEMLITAEFAGDVKRADELKAKLAESAAKRNERGDFENLGMSVNMDVREFYKSYEPLKQNYEAREKDKESKRKLQESGAIDMNMYNSWEKRSAMQENSITGDLTPYTGITYNEDGTHDRNSIYQPTPIAKFVDVQGEITKALQAIESSKGGGKVTRLPKMIDTTGDGVGDTEFMVQESDGTWEKITKEQVEAVTQEVLNRGDVRAYLDQDADFSTFELTEDELTSKLANRISQLDGRLASGNLTQEEEANVRAQLISYKKALSSGTVGGKRKLAAAAAVDARNESFTKTAVSNKAMNNVVGGQEIWEYSALTQENWMRTRSLNPAASPRQSTVLGASEELSSSFADPESGKVTEESATQVISDTEAVARGAIAGFVLNYPAIFENFEGLTAEAISDISMDMLDHMSRGQMEAMLTTASNEGKLVNAEGARVSVNQALDEFTSAKESAESYLAINDAYQLLFDENREQARNEGLVTSSQGMADNPEWSGALTRLLREEEKRTKKLQYLPGNTSGVAYEPGALLQESAQAIFRGIFNGEDMTEDHPLYGDVKEYVHTAFKGNLTEAEVEDAYNLVVEQGQELISEGRLPPSHSATSSASVFNGLASDGHDREMELLNEGTKGQTSYPIADKPLFTTQDTWDGLLEAVQSGGVNTLVTRTAAGSDNTIQEELGGNWVAESVSSIGTTWITGKDGLPKPVFTATFKGGDASGKSRTEEKAVAIDPSVLVAQAPGLNFSLNTLSNKIVARALQVYNNAPRAIGNSGVIKIKYNDTSSEGLGNDLEFTFHPSIEQVVDGAPTSMNLTTGKVEITGERLGVPINPIVVTYDEWATSMLQLGVDMNRREDVMANSSSRQASTAIDVTTRTYRRGN